MTGQPNPTMQCLIKAPATVFAFELGETTASYHIMIQSPIKNIFVFNLESGHITETWRVGTLYQEILAIVEVSA